MCNLVDCMLYLPYIPTLLNLSDRYEQNSFSNDLMFTQLHIKLKILIIKYCLLIDKFALY